jgi:radical SAM superfamily enzyme YgiQ (UPF0313 family)
LSVKGNYTAPPLGVHRLASWLRKHGHNAEVYDFNLGGDFSAMLSSRPWQIIGFSSLQVSLPRDIRAAQQAKGTCHDAQIIFGGLEATLNYQDILDCAPCDVIALGEGEKLMLDLANGKPASACAGCIVRRHAEPTTPTEFAAWWDTIDFRAMRYEDYWQQTRALEPDADPEVVNTVRLVTSSHCTRGCAFCSVTRWHAAACGQMVPTVALTPEQVYRLVCRVQEEVPSVKTVYFCEDDFIVTRERAYKAFELLGKTGLNFLVQTRLDKIAEGLVQHMAANGCSHITIGVENASEDVLRAFGKPQKLEMVSQVIRWCTEAGVTPYLLFILFGPTATRRDLEINVERISKWIGQGATVSIEPNMRCYRGSPLWDSPHDMLYQVDRVRDGAAKVGQRNAIRTPIRILPDDPEARAIAEEFNRRWPDYLAAQHENHAFKGATGKHMIDLLGQLVSGY